MSVVVNTFFYFFYTMLIGKDYKAFYLNDMVSIHVFANVCFLEFLRGVSVWDIGIIRLQFWAIG